MLTVVHSESESEILVEYNWFLSVLHHKSESELESHFPGRPGIKDQKVCYLQ